MIEYVCECTEPKTRRVVFDGGKTTGEYSIEMCQVCYDNDNKKFIIISEEILQ